MVATVLVLGTVFSEKDIEQRYPADAQVADDKDTKPGDSGGEEELSCDEKLIICSQVCGRDFAENDPGRGACTRRCAEEALECKGLGRKEPGGGGFLEWLENLF